jgi:hypothetical protein
MTTELKIENQDLPQARANRDIDKETMIDATIIAVKTRTDLVHYARPD